MRRNHEAYLAHGLTQKGWDIVLLSKNKCPRRIQIKTIDWPEALAVNGIFDSGFEISVIVLLNGSENVRYLVIPRLELERLISPHNANRKGKQRTLTVSKNFATDTSKNIISYEDNWSAFRDETA